jgi:flagellar biosynthetic protein FliR
VRLILGLAITLAIAPALPPMPAIDPASAAGLLILAQQMLIGFAMGFAMRLVFSAVDLAGSMISLQMGLGFASSTTRRPPVRREWSRSSWACWLC